MRFSSFALAAITAATTTAVAVPSVESDIEARAPRTKFQVNNFYSQLDDAGYITYSFNVKSTVGSPEHAKFKKTNCQATQVKNKEVHNGKCDDPSVTFKFVEYKLEPEGGHVGWRVLVNHNWEKRVDDIIYIYNDEGYHTFAKKLIDGQNFEILPDRSGSA